MGFHLNMSNTPKCLLRAGLRNYVQIPSRLAQENVTNCYNSAFDFPMYLPVSLISIATWFCNLQPKNERLRSPNLILFSIFKRKIDIIFYANKRIILSNWILFFFNIDKNPTFLDNWKCLVCQQKNAPERGAFEFALF